MRQIGALALTLAAAVSGVSCAGQVLRFNVQTAPSFGSGHKSVSVFGVYRGGSMSTTYWEVLGPQVEPALGWKSCAIGFSRRLAFSDPVFFSRLQDEAKKEGVTKTLLKQVASRARGELLLVVSVFGRPPPPQGQSVGRGRSGGGGFNMGGRGMGGRGGGRMGGGMMGGGGMGGGRMGGGMMGKGGRPGGSGPTGAARRREGGRQGMFEVFAELYSARTLEVVAQLEMQYRGPSLDEAIMKFAQKLQTVLPDSACLGWRNSQRH